MEPGRFRKHGTLEVATAYLEYLYSPEAQQLIARNYYRPSLQSVADKYAPQFPRLQLVAIKDFGGWKAVQAKHFDDGAIFDQIMRR